MTKKQETVVVIGGLIVIFGMITFLPLIDAHIRQRQIEKERIEEIVRERMPKTTSEFIKALIVVKKLSRCDHHFADGTYSYSDYFDATGKVLFCGDYYELEEDRQLMGQWFRNMQVDLKQ